ncbi:MAG TPA: class I SAM-dependent methyltransferase [Candidatus Acidoferrales bacterium]|nr:class I SAM-dependent methyltransferase [Candidatus Acidoferrales bacterium]
MSASAVLGRRIDLVQTLHASTKRNYVARVTEFDKAECAEVASQFGVEYWDGDRRYGYGGYRYDGRWRDVAEKLAELYGLRAGDRVLDVGCGKGYLLYELTQVVPGLIVRGLDISAYAIAESKPEVRSQLVVGDAASLPFDDGSFDVVVSLGTLHNLPVASLWAALREIARVGASERAYVMVESFRDQREKANLLYWQLTCRSFYSVEDWEFVFRETGYRGDYGFIFFT